MTRGRESNSVYVATDQHHLEEHQHRQDLQHTARSILYGILQHPGAELSAHDTITQAAGQQRWIRLLETGGLSPEAIDELVETDAFGILTTELRRLEADGHHIDGLLPRIIHAGDLEDVQDLGSLLRYRLHRITTTYPPSTRRATGRIAGLVPRATGITDPDMHQALQEWEELMEQRLDALTQQHLTLPPSWAAGLDGLTSVARAVVVRAVAAYRDQWGITASSPLGTIPLDDAQRIDYERTRATLTHATETIEPVAPGEQPRRDSLTLA